MTNTQTVLKTTGAIIGAAFVMSTSAFGAVVYDNSTTYLNKFVSPGSGVEFGDEITLGGSQRTITDFSFEYFYSGADLSGAKGVLIIHAQDGTPDLGGNFTPGTELFRSGEFDLLNSFNTVNVNGINVDASGSPSITWSVVFSGLSLTDNAGLLVYSPPTVGNSFDDYWQKTGGTWVLTELDAGATPANFAAQITAVPEPGTMALLVGGLSWLALSRRRKA